MKNQFAIKHLEYGWELTKEKDFESVVMKRGVYPISITYAVVNIAHPEYPLCFTDSAGLAQDIANALNIIGSQAADLKEEVLTQQG